MDNVWFHFVAVLLIQNAILTLSLVFPERQQPSNQPDANQNYYNPNLENGVTAPNVPYIPQNVPYIPPKMHHNRGRKKNNVGKNDPSVSRYGPHYHSPRKHGFHNRRLGPPGNQSPWNHHSQTYHPNYYYPFNSAYNQVHVPKMNCTEKLNRRHCQELNKPCTTNVECCTWNCKEKKCRPSRSGSCTRDNECNTEICLKTFDICKCSCANFGRKCTDNDDCCFGVCNTTTESNNKLICVCKKIGETCFTRNDCCGENWMCANGICVDNTIIEAAPEETSKTNLETSTKTEINVQAKAESEPQMKIETKPKAIAKIETEMTTRIEPEMTNRMKPGMTNRMKPEMTNRIEPEMTPKVETNTINKIEPGMTTNMN